MVWVIVSLIKYPGLFSVFQSILLLQRHASAQLCVCSLVCSIYCSNPEVISQKTKKKCRTQGFEALNSLTDRVLCITSDLPTPSEFYVAKSKQITLAVRASNQLRRNLLVESFWIFNYTWIDAKVNNSTFQAIGHLYPDNKNIARLYRMRTQKYGIICKRFVF